MDHDKVAERYATQQHMMHGGGGVGPSPTSAARALGIPSQIEAISNMVTGVEETLAQLYHRLDHVMRGAPPETSRSNDKVEVGPSSGMENDLSQIRYRISTLNTALNQIISRLEL